MTEAPRFEVRYNADTWLVYDGIEHRYGRTVTGLHSITVQIVTALNEGAYSDMPWHDHPKTAALSVRYKP